MCLVLRIRDNKVLYERIRDDFTNNKWLEKFLSGSVQTFYDKSGGALFKKTRVIYVTFHEWGMRS